jgi:hypothetical protein
MITLAHVVTRSVGTIIQTKSSPSKLPVEQLVIEVLMHSLRQHHSLTLQLLSFVHPASTLVAIATTNNTKNFIA